MSNIALPPTALPPASSLNDGSSSEDKRMDCATDGTTPPSKAPSINTDALLSTPTKKNSSVSLDEYAASVATTPKSSCSHRYRNKGPNSSCSKRRRIASSEDDENIGEISPIASNSFMAGSGSIGSARKLNYEIRNNNYDSDDNSDDSSGEEEEVIDPFDQELVEMRQKSILKKMKVVNGEEEEDQVIETTVSAKIYECVKDYDVVTNTWTKSNASSDRKDESEEKAEGRWVYRGSGCVKFIKCLVEGYDCGMIRMQLTKNGTLDIIMRHELIFEVVKPMQSKKGKAYTWMAKKDYAYQQWKRTFAIRFDDDMAAMSWKEQVEQSKVNNQRIRRGLDVPEAVVLLNNVVVNDVCSHFEKLSTSPSSSPTRK